MKIFDENGNSIPEGEYQLEDGRTLKVDSDGNEKTGIAKMSVDQYEDMTNRLPSHLLTFYILESGFAGVNRNGTIVDRRIYPDAVPMKPGGISIAPTPKDVN